MLWLLLIIITGSVTWLLTMVKSGLVYSYGMGFWGPNGHDGVWHLALIESLKRGTLEMPIYAGEQIKNYHIGFDLLLAWISKLTMIPSVNLYFQVLPIVTSVLIGYLTYRLVFVWTKSQVQALWATFFVYFGGSFGYLVSLFREQTIGGESMFWSQQGISTLINPPFALSLVFLLCGLLALHNYTEKKNILSLGLIILCFSVLAQVKVYAGILGLGSLFVAGAFYFWKHKNPQILIASIISLALSAVLFFPLNKNSSGLVVFQPFWFLETMMALSDRFYWPKFYEAMTNYRLGDVWHKMLAAYGIAFLIFLLGNLGTRVVGLKEVWSRVRKPDTLGVFMLCTAAGGVFFPMFFLQKGTPWNTIQFFYYTLFVFSLYAGITLGKWFENKRMSHVMMYVTAFFIILLTIPSTYATLKHYLPNRPPAMISKEELEALNFLADRPTGVVLTYPYDAEKAQKAISNPPRPLYLYESTAYVSAFSKKPVYLENEVNLNITGFDWRKRRLEVEEWQASTVHEYVPRFLRDRNIKYVYWVKPQRATLGESQLGMKLIFENKQVTIYEVE